MVKLDMRAALKPLYSPSAREISTVEVPSLQCLMIDGRGDPNTSEDYARSLEALYAVAYGLKFAAKKAGGDDWSVMPLECLWWSDEAGAFGGQGDRSSWQWTMLIAQPESVTPEHVRIAIDQAARKRPSRALQAIRLERLAEGLAAQILYTGPYADEDATIARLHAWITDHGYAPQGKHHEVYLNDPRRTAPENLKTILRQPIRSL
ncbi:MAG: hypothetical protein GXX94_04930 [Chloroflexi bacterium]|nr:hypothetical protein [Chloroflexota bacterium]